jgi:hypothetical protein
MNRAGREVGRSRPSSQDLRRRPLLGQFEEVKEGDRAKHKGDDGDQLERNWRPREVPTASQSSVATSDIVIKIIKNV